MNNLLYWIAEFIVLPTVPDDELIFLQYLVAYMILFVAVLLVFNIIVGIIMAIFSPRRMR